MSEEIDKLFQQALQLNDIECEQFLASLPEEQRAELKMLLAADAAVQDGDFLEPQSTVIQKVEIDDIPKQIGPYKILEHIAEGGMGTVFMAEQKKPIRRRVAIKIIKSDSPSKEIIARFEAERQALAMMDHQNIAKVLDAGITENKLPYFAMEYIKGIPLTEYCDSNRLTPNERLELFIQMCRAIQHAHQKGVIHRDIKPSNVLVALYDGKPIIKVIDFGLAKALQDQLMLTDKTLFTSHNRAVGTWQYMSPEQAEMNNLDVDTRTDIYALGVVLFELLTGSTPLTSKQLSKVEGLARIKLVKEEETPRPSVRLSDSGDALKTISAQRKTDVRELSKLIQGELDWIALKALDKDRSRRYESAAAFADDVQRFLHDETVEARPPSLGYRLGKTFRNHRGPILAGASFVTLLIVCLVAMSRLLWEFSVAKENETTAKNDAIETSIENQRLAKELKEEARQSRQERDVARAAEASANFQLASARWDANRAGEARDLLHQIPQRYRDNFEWQYCNRHFLGSDITCYGHADEIHCTSFSPDGRHVVSGSTDYTIKLWDAATGQELETLTGHDDAVSSVCFSPDGTRIVSGSEDATVRLWDAVTGDELKSLKGHGYPVNSVSFSPDGTHIVSCGHDYSVKLWDAVTGEQIDTHRQHKSWVYSVCFSPDGTWVASGSYGNSIILWNLVTGEKTKLRGHTSSVHSVKFSPDSTRLASASGDSTIKLWNVNAGTQLHTLKGHAESVNGLSFSPDGARIVSGSKDQTIKLWDAATGLRAITLNGHTERVLSVSFSPDGTSIASGGWDKTVRLWNAATGEENGILEGHSEPVREVCFSPDGTRIASASFDKTIRIWNSVTHIEVVRLEGHTDGVNSVSFSPDGTKIVSASDDETIRIWNPNTGEIVRILDGHASFVRSVMFSRDGTRIASGSGDKTVRLWDSTTGQLLRTLPPGHTRRVFCVDFNPDGSLIASGSWDKTIMVWDTTTGLPTMTLKGHTSRVNCVRFSRDGTRIASGSVDNTVKLWDATTGVELCTFKGHTENVRSVSFNQDGKCIASGSWDKTIKLWDATEEQEFITLKGHTKNVDSVSFSPDGTFLYSQSQTDKIVWRTKDGLCIPNAKWSPPEDPIRLTPDGLLAVPYGEEILLVDTNFKTTPSELAYRAAKARHKSWWHEERLAAVLQEKDWYAATFHAAWLLTLQPDSLDAYNALQMAHDQLEPAVSKLTPPVVANALKLPKP